MKNDVLTLAAIVFVLGLLLSTVNVSDMLGYSEQETPVALQQGK
ncbi:hypothetical protein [Agarilytica rhodophyticola]|nr:hypothetical protein [Agarilytica rhodophyticola]